MTGATETEKAVKPIWKCLAKDCDYTTPPTLKGYEKQAGHQLYHAKRGVLKEKRGFCLIDESTGDILAQTLKEAGVKGFLMLEAPPEKPKKVEPPISKTPPVEPPKTPDVIDIDAADARRAAEKAEAEAKAEAKVEAKTKAEAEEKAKPEAKGEKEEEKEKEITTPQVSSDGFFRYTITLPADAFALFNMAKAAGREKDISFDVWVWDCIRKRFEKDYKLQVILAGIGEE